VRAKDILGVPLEEGQLVACGTGRDDQTIAACIVVEVGLPQESEGWAFVHLTDITTGQRWIACSDDLVVVDGFRGEK